MKYILAIDQGTTNSRAIIFTHDGLPIASHGSNLTQHFPKTGWVEQDAMEMVNHTIACCRAVVKNANISPRSIEAIGITNQRETTIVWDKKTGLPIYPAIVWQDRRTSEYCDELKPANDMIANKTGLLLDPYFSATKIKWILQTVKGARAKALNGDLLFGTVDCFLLWHLTQEKHHATDISNAARTLLFNIHEQCWDQALLNLFEVPERMLPTVYDNTHHFGHLNKAILGINIPICAMAGDQQAASIGQASFSRGMIKATYGTGCFVVLNTGKEVIHSHNRLLSTILYRVNGEVTYALEGSIFSAGVIVKWLRDNLQLIKTATETEDLARAVETTEGVYCVPAFTGLGAPYWNPNAKGCVTGLTARTHKAHVVRAALESVAYQTVDLMDAIKKDFQAEIKNLRVDGGMVENGWLMQFIANMLDMPLHRQQSIETTALGVAYLAGLQIGRYSSLAEIASLWKEHSHYHPNMLDNERKRLYAGWKNAVFTADRNVS